ncbi:MAG: M28 family peptidase [Chitinophagaceae bacterium]|nr:M28 family peptidase [Chitinophagaceae bacterium]
MCVRRRLSGAWLLLLAAGLQVAVQSQAQSVISADSLSSWVQQLSHDSMEGRLTNSAGGSKAARWLESRFLLLGLHSVQGNDGFFHVYNYEYGEVAMQSVNMMGAIRGGLYPDSIIIISSHYDHIGTVAQYQKVFGMDDPLSNTPVRKGDRIYNGANDNASGVACMLGLAQYINALPVLPDYTVLFVAFSGEELGLKGSQALADEMEPGLIKRVINLEMMGRPRGDKPIHYTPMLTVAAGDKTTLDLFNSQYRQMSKDSSGQPLYSVARSARFGSLYERSDNYSFFLKGIPANTIMLTGDRDPYYHHPGDEWNTLDYELMAKNLQAIALSVLPFLFSKK